MWNGKNKSVTFSFDDGISQDIRLVGIFNKYGLKCTFNLNSGIMNESGSFDIGSVKVRRMSESGLAELYKGHEAAVHTLTHPDLLQLDDASVRSEILGDKERLESIFGYEICGMAYPYGTFDERIINIARACGIKYSRTVCDTHSFDVPGELMKLGASCHHGYDGVFSLIDEFLEYSGEAPAVLNIWGHSYEFERDGSWERFEEICRRVSRRKDVFYGTNKEVYLSGTSNEA